MLTVSYSYYSTEYYGDKLTEAEFPKYLKSARLELNNATFGKSSKLVDSEDELPVCNEVRDCLCEVADKIKYFDDNNFKEVQSESLGSHSINYSSKSADVSYSKAIKGIISRHLDSYGLTSFPQW